MLLFKDRVESVDSGKMAIGNKKIEKKPTNNKINKQTNKQTKKQQQRDQEILNRYEYITLKS